MELGLLILAILGLFALIGGLISFFSFLGRAAEKTQLEQRLQQIEQQLKQLQQHQQGTPSAAQASPGSSIHAPSRPIVQDAAALQTGDAALTQPSPALDWIDAQALESQALASVAEPAEPPHQPLSAQQDSVRIQADNDWPLAPAAPGLITRGITAARDWLFGGNTLVRSGVVILFIGLSFLLKYAAEHSHVPIALRLTGIALLGVALLVLGWRLRLKRAEYSWAIQGGGVGVLYLTIFAAMKLYQLIPPGLAFVLLVAIAALSAMMAVLQSAMPLAMLGFAGGFLAPIFTSTGGGSHVGLFSYYLVLNLGIALIAVQRSWRPLNVLGFVFTFVIGTLWGAKAYRPALFASTEPFLIIHFLLFTLIAVIYAHRQATKASDYVDATLVFGTPLVGFSLQYALLPDSQFGLAYSALALGLFYIALAWWTLRRRRDTLQFLGECFLALGIGFATLTLPLALDGRWTSAAWAVEGVGLLWVGLRQGRTFPKLAGLALQLLAATAFAWGWLSHGAGNHDNMFLGVAFIALSGWACGALLNRYLPGRMAWLGWLLAGWGWLWWIGAGLTAIDQFLPEPWFVHVSLLFAALTSALLPRLAARIAWPVLGSLCVLLLPAMALATLAEINGWRPSGYLGWLAWPVAFAVYLRLLRGGAIITGSLWRAPLLWMAAYLLAREWHSWLFAQQGLVWRDIGWALGPMLIMAAVMYAYGKRAMSTEQHRSWLWVGCAPLAGYLLLWFVASSLAASGNPAPLPYVPLLNPLDLTLGAILLMLLLWQQSVRQQLPRSSVRASIGRYAPAITGILAFMLLNGMLLRSLHYWAGTPFQWTAIFDYRLVQMSFTLLWSLTALGLMLVAHRLSLRRLWLVGAALMGIVVLKLFLLDLAGHGSVERIISFIGAGMLLLVMGYFAPLPPAPHPPTKEAT